MTHRLHDEQNAESPPPAEATRQPAPPAPPLLAKGIYPPPLPLRDRWHDKCTLWRGVLCLKNPNVHDLAQINARRVIAPLNIRPTLIELAHDHATAGHFGYEKTKQRLQSHWFWPNMSSEIEKHCKSCKICLETNAPYKYNLAPLEQLSVPRFFADRVHADLLGPMPLDQGNKYILSIIDAFSGYVTVVPIPDKTAETVSNAFFEKFCCVHGMINTLVTDQGSEFKNGIMAKLCLDLNISQRYSSPAHPRSNGMAERLNRKIISYLRKYLGKGNDWVQLVAPLQLSINSAVHSTTNYTPHFLAFFRKPLLPTSILEPKYSYSEDVTQARFSLFQQILHDVTKAENSAFQKQKVEFDKRANLRYFELGDMVMCTRPKSGTQFQKFQKSWEGPFELIAKLGNNNMLLKRLGAKKSIVRHADRLKAAPFLNQLYTQTRQASQAAPLLPPDDSQAIPVLEQRLLRNLPSRLTKRNVGAPSKRGYVDPTPMQVVAPELDPNDNENELLDNPVDLDPILPTHDEQNAEPPPPPPAEAARRPTPPPLQAKGIYPPPVPLRDRWHEEEKAAAAAAAAEADAAASKPSRTTRLQTKMGGPAPTDYPHVSDTHKRRQKK
jgi:transposase InsO family protein